MMNRNILMTTASSKRLLWLLIFSFSLFIVNGSIQDIDVIIYPSEEFVQYTTAFIRVPGGLVDLSGLHLNAVTPSYIDMESEMDDEYLEEMINENDDDNVKLDDTTGATGEDNAGGDGSGDDGGNRRSLKFLKNTPETTTSPTASPINTNENNDSKSPAGKDSTFNIAVFPVPTSCAKDLSHCSWAGIGVGKEVEGDLRWCCTNDSIQAGLCSLESIGQLLIDPDKFPENGRLISIPVPYEGCPTELQDQIVDGRKISDSLAIPEQAESATYVVMFSNCDTTYGHDVQVKGSISFLSEHGFLPGELYGFMRFYSAVTVLYIILFLWFYCLMRTYSEQRIDIEKWIFTTISVGCIEMVFRSMDYYVWNNTGSRSSAIIWVGLLAGVFKQAFSRCLLVMVSLGWGVIRNSLGGTMTIIITIGIAYVVTLIMQDAMVLYAMEKVYELSYKSESKILNVVTLLSVIKFAIDAIFLTWIFDSLNKTIAYLSTQKSQSHKLARTYSLLYIVVAFVIVRVLIIIASFVDKGMVQKGGDGLLQEEFEWAIDASIEIAYLIVLAAVAVLWQPNASARDYAYAMELASGEDEDDLELSQMDSIPSAMDDERTDYQDNGMKGRQFS